MVEISVIIPVYNDAAHVQQAVESALMQPETAEVILAEDGSSDASLAVCRALAAEHERVICVQHADGANRGAGPTRNLGVDHATCEIVSFLDADDYFLPDRFQAVTAILAQRPEVEGVYDAITMHYETEAARAEFEAANANLRQRNLFRPRAPLEGDAIAAAALNEQGLYFTPIALTLRRQAFLRTGGFPDQKLGQDVAFSFRLAFTTYMAPGSYEQPVAVYRRGEQNRSRYRNNASARANNTLALRLDMFAWAVQHLPARTHPHVLYQTLQVPHPNKIRRKLYRLQALALAVHHNPALLRTGWYYRKWLAELRLAPHRPLPAVAFTLARERVDLSGAAAVR